MLYVKTDEEKRVLYYTENLEEAEVIGYDTTVKSEEDFEWSYDCLRYIKGYAPESPYTWKRKQEYPSIEEQLDMIWHLMEEGLLGEDVKKSNFFKKIKKVKDKYPKD